MSQYSHERNGTYMGDPSSKGSVKSKNGNGVGGASFKGGNILKGMPSHNTSDFPKFPGYGKGGKEQRNSTIKKGSI